MSLPHGGGSSARLRERVPQRCARGPNAARRESDSRHVRNTAFRREPDHLHRCHPHQPNGSGSRRGTSIACTGEPQARCGAARPPETSRTTGRWPDTHAFSTPTLSPSRRSTDHAPPSVSFRRATTHCISRGGTTSRYDDIYNGFAVRKGRFDRVVKRDHEALGLGSGSRYQLRWGVDLMVSRGVAGFGCSTFTSSRSVSARVSPNPVQSLAVRLPGRSGHSKHGSTPAGARACRSWCLGISTARSIATDTAIICGPPSTTATRRGSRSTGCPRAATLPAGEARLAISVTPSTSSSSALGHGSGSTRRHFARSYGPVRTRMHGMACRRITVRLRWTSIDSRMPE